MDKKIKDITKYIGKLSSEDRIIIFIESENKSFTISPDDLMNLSIREYEFPEEMKTAIQSSFNNPNVVYEGTSSPFLYDICEHKGKIQTDIILTVRRTIIFNYDSYIYFNEYDNSKPDYWNYTAQAILNDKVYICRLMIYKDNTWKISCYPITDRGNQTISNTL